MRVDYERVSQVAALLRANPPKTSGPNFYSVQTYKGPLVLNQMYPSLNHSCAIDFFFFTVMHNFGLWYGDSEGYVRPLTGRLYGGDKELKGSEFLWALFKRALDRDSRVFAPQFLATVDSQVFIRTFMDDGQALPWPDFEERLKLTRQYGQYFLEIGITPTKVLDMANKRDHPLDAFLGATGHIPGYNSDELRKKNILLAMVLANRPEKFLKPIDDEKWPPIVDYHLMRVALRLGLVELWPSDGPICDQLEGRKWVSASDERMVRFLVWQAIKQLIVESGLTMAGVDEILWMARKYCPEMTEPECARCMFHDVCVKRTELFQPVFRTTAY